MFLYGLLWMVGWIALGGYILKETGVSSPDRRLRPLAFVCFAISAMPLAYLAYIGSFFILYWILGPRDFTAF